jgi:hypothetical protein
VVQAEDGEHRPAVVGSVDAVGDLDALDRAALQRRADRHRLDEPRMVGHELLEVVAVVGVEAIGRPAAGQRRAGDAPCEGGVGSRAHLVGGPQVVDDRGERVAGAAQPLLVALAVQDDLRAAGVDVVGDVEPGRLQRVLVAPAQRDVDQPRDLAAGRGAHRVQVEADGRGVRGARTPARLRDQRRAGGQVRLCTLLGAERRRPRVGSAVGREQPEVPVAVLAAELDGHDPRPLRVKRSRATPAVPEPSRRCWHSRPTGSATRTSRAEAVAAGASTRRTRSGRRRRMKT